MIEIQLLPRNGNLIIIGDQFTGMEIKCFKYKIVYSTLCKVLLIASETGLLCTLVEVVHCIGKELNVQFSFATSRGPIEILQ